MPVAAPWAASSPTPRASPLPSGMPHAHRHRQAERLGHLLRSRVHCTATDRGCVVNAMYVRADYVVSSYSEDAVSLLAPHCHSAPSRSFSTSAGLPELAERLDEHSQDHAHITLSLLNK